LRQPSARGFGSERHDEAVYALVELIGELMGEGSAPQESPYKRLPPTAPAAAPTTTPTTTPPSATGNDSDDDEQQDCTDGSVDDESDGSNTQVNVQSRQQPITDKSAEDAYDQVPDEAEPAAAYDLTCQPPGNNADQHDDDEAFIRQVHGDSSESDRGITFSYVGLVAYGAENNSGRFGNYLREIVDWPF
jgi:hypothetical protein